MKQHTHKNLRVLRALRVLRDSKPFHIPHSPVCILQAAILLFALVPFLTNLGSYFLSDDFVLLGWTQVHSLREVASFFDPNTFWFYRPLVKVYYWAGQSLFGLNAVPFHLFSVLLHGLNGYLVYRLAAREAKWGWQVGLAAALIFMLVPYHAETVSWIAATGDLFAATCILSALILMRRYWEQGMHSYLLFALALFATGLFTRETAVMLPVLLLFDTLIFARVHLDKDGPLPVTRLVLVLTGYVALLVGYFLVQVIGKGSAGLTERGGLAFHSLNIESILLGMMEYVHGLVPSGGFLSRLPLDMLRVVVWVEAVIMLAVALLLWRARQRLALFGLAWWLVIPLLFIFFSVPTDRYFYLPSIGYAILAASLLAGLPGLVEKWRLRVPLKLAWTITALLAASLLLFQANKLLAKQSAWRAAGMVSGNVFRDTRQAAPDPNDYAAFFFVDLPPNLNGVPTFGNGIQQAIQLLYDNRTLTASMVTCDYLRAQVELPRYSYFFQFRGNSVQPLASKDGCR